MPHFETAFSSLKADRQVTHEELVRAIRYMIAAEYEAVQLYMQLAESTDNELAQRVLKDIADEEIVHAGEFLTLLKHLSPEEEGFYREGEKEVLEMMAASEQNAASPEAEEAPAEEQSAGTAASTVGNLYEKE